MFKGMTHDDFDSAVQRHQQKVFTFARYLLSNREEAEDVTQEVLVRLWSNLGSVAPDRLGGWLLKVTRNACYDRLRSHRSRSRVETEHVPGESLCNVPARTPDPEILAGSSQLGRSLLEALGSLREPQRSTVILREIQGLSYREIAQALDLTEATVRVTLHRGRRTLREHLREAYHGTATASRSVL